AAGVVGHGLGAAAAALRVRRLRERRPRLAHRLRVVFLQAKLGAALVRLARLVERNRLLAFVSQRADRIPVVLESLAKSRKNQRRIFRVLTVGGERLEDDHIRGPPDARDRLRRHEHGELFHSGLIARVAVLAVDEQLPQVLVEPGSRDRPDDVTSDVSAEQERRLHFSVIDVDAGLALLQLDFGLERGSGRTATCRRNGNIDAAPIGILDDVERESSSGRRGRRRDERGEPEDRKRKTPLCHGDPLPKDSRTIPGTLLPKSRPLHARKGSCKRVRWILRAARTGTKARIQQRRQHVTATAPTSEADKKRASNLETSRARPRAWRRGRSSLSDATHRGRRRCRPENIRARAPDLSRAHPSERLRSARPRVPPQPGPAGRFATAAARARGIRPEATCSCRSRWGTPPGKSLRSTGSNDGGTR